MEIITVNHNINLEKNNQTNIENIFKEIQEDEINKLIHSYISIKSMIEYILAKQQVEDPRGTSFSTKEPISESFTNYILDYFDIDKSSILLYDKYYFFKMDYGNLYLRLNNKILDRVENEILINRRKFLSLEDAKAKYPKTDNLTIGTYTTHPKSSKKLVKLESFHKNLALEKDDELIVLLGRMGAKKIIISTKKESNRKADLDLMLLSSKSKTDNDSEKELLVEFEGNDFSIDENLLEKSLWFSDDSQLNSIFESRKFQKNKIKKYTIKLTYSDTFDFDFDFACGLFKRNINLRSSYDKLKNVEKLFSVEF